MAAYQIRFYKKREDRQGWFLPGPSHVIDLDAADDVEAVQLAPAHVDKHDWTSGELAQLFTADGRHLWGSYKPDFI